MIKMLIHRDYVRKFKVLEEKRKLLMTEVNCTVCGIICLINYLADNNKVLEDIDRTCNTLNVSMEK